MDIGDSHSGVEDNPDYVTLMPAIHDHRCVVVMRWNHGENEYQIYKCSDRMTKNAAEHLAQSWAAALGAEIR